MKDKFRLKQLNSVDLVPFLGCVPVVLYLFYILLCNLVVALIPNGNWSDGTKSMASLFVFVIFYSLAQYEIPKTIKNYDYVIYGILLTMALINSNPATFLLIGALIFSGLGNTSASRGLHIFLTLAFALEGLQIFLIYNGLDGNMVNEIFVRNSWFVVWILVGLILHIKKPEVLTADKKNDCNKGFSVLSYLFYALFLLCFLGGVVQRFFCSIPYIGKYLELPYSGHGIPELFNTFGRNYKLVCILLIIFLLGMHILCFLHEKGRKERISILFFLMTCYSVLFADWLVLLIAFVGLGLYFVSLCWNKKIKLISLEHMKNLQLVILGVIILVISAVITQGVNRGMNKKHTRIEISTSQLQECEGALVGYDVLPDGCLRSNRIDPWIVLYYGQFGLFDVQNVNVQVKYCKRDYMYIFGIGRYNYDFRVIKKGDNYMDITFLTPDDMGLRIDLTEAYDSYILLDKIVFNDYTYIGTSLSNQLRMAAYLLWMFALVRILFSGFYHKALHHKAEENS